MKQAFVIVIATAFVAACSGCKNESNDVALKKQIEQLSDQVDQLSGQLQAERLRQSVFEVHAEQKMGAIIFLSTNLLSARYADEAAINTNADILARYQDIVDEHSAMLRTHSLWLRAITNCVAIDESYLVGVSNCLSSHSDAIAAIIVMEGHRQNDSQENLDLQRQRNEIMAIQAELMNESIRDQEINQVIKETIPTAR